MNKVQEQVLEFHKAGGHLISEFPSRMDNKNKDLRRRLIQEEVDELFEEMLNYDENLVGIADALGDILYVVYGTAISYGIDMEPISDEIHRSNMTKFGKAGEYKKTCDESGKSIKDDGGKTLKPSTFEPPRLAEIIIKQLRAKGQF